MFLSLRLVAEGKSDAEFSFDHLLCISTSSEVLM